MKTQFVLIILTAVILVYGCAHQNRNPPPEKNIFTGTQGLEVSFFEESVPKSTFDDTLLIPTLILENKGAVNVNNAIVTLHYDKDVVVKPKVPGTNVRYFSRETPPIELEGKEVTRGSTGEREIMQFPLTTERLQSEEKRETVFSVSVCYEYQTKAIASACIDTLAHSFTFQKQTKPCKVQPILMQSQGAPVAVSRIEQTMQPITSGDGKSIVAVKPIFKIFVTNVGKGSIIDKGDLENYCTDEKGTVKQANVVVSAKLSGKELDCGPGLIYLVNTLGDNFITCRYTTGAAVTLDGFSTELGTFVSPLEIVLSYGYTYTTETRTITIERTLKPTGPERRIYTGEKCIAANGNCRSITEGCIENEQQQGGMDCPPNEVCCVVRTNP